MSDEDEARLAQWLAADERHARAFATIERMWDAIDAETMPRASPLSVCGERRGRGWPERRWRWKAHARRPARWVHGAVAASLALLLVWQVGDISIRLRADARTGTGEQQRITLPDGSIVHLNTGSAVAFDYGRERRLRLLRGEAAFTVAPDATRPFVVEASDATVTALGTRFLLRIDERRTRVAVTEHSVRLALTKGESLVVGEGEVRDYGEGRIGERGRISASDADAWTRGVIRVVNQPLDRAVREIGRYHQGYVAVMGDGLARRPVNGVFSTAAPVHSIDAIEQTLGIRSTRIGTMLIVLHD